MSILEKEIRDIVEKEKTLKRSSKPLSSQEIENYCRNPKQYQKDIDFIDRLAEDKNAKAKIISIGIRTGLWNLIKRFIGDLSPSVLYPVLASITLLIGFYLGLTIQSYDQIDDYKRTRNIPYIQEVSSNILKDMPETVIPLTENNIILYPFKGNKNNLKIETKNNSLFIKGRRGFLFFDKTANGIPINHTNYKFSGEFKINSPGTLGYSLVLRGDRSDDSSVLAGRGIGISFDRYMEKILVKQYPEDTTLMSYSLPHGFDYMQWHRLEVSANIDDYFTVSLDDQKNIMEFHNYSYPKGRIGLRVWGSNDNDLDMEVKNLSIEARDISIASTKPYEIVHDNKSELYTILVGIGQFYSTHIPELRVSEDIEKIYQVLNNFAGKRNTYQISFENYDATINNVQYAASVKSQYGKKDEDDILIVYLAGHAVDIGNDRFYLLTSKTNTSSIASLQASSIDLRTLIDSAAVHNHSLILFLLDTCLEPVSTSHFIRIAGNKINNVFQNRNFKYSSNVIRDLQKLVPRENVVIFAASSNKAIETKQGGVFTRFFVKGLRGYADGYYDNRKDGQITLKEIVKYTQDNVEKETDGSQVPLYSNNMIKNGNIVITYAN